MSDKRDVFTILEDNSTAEGGKLPARAEGDAIGGNHVPSLVAKDAAGNYALIEKRAAGDAVPSGLAALPVKDLAGNVQYINARDEGNAISGVDALPGLVAKDLSSNFAYLKVNADGELLVSAAGDGTELKSTAIVTPSAINTLTTVVELTLAISKSYEDAQVRGSSFFPVKWELVQVNDVTLTVLDSFLTGSGQFTFNIPYKHMSFSSGGSGVQKLRLRATQLNGAVTDMHGYIEIFQKQ